MGSSCKQTQVTFLLSVSHPKKHCAYPWGQTNILNVFSSIFGNVYSHVYPLAILAFTAIQCALLHIFTLHHWLLINKRNMYISPPVLLYVYMCIKVQQRGPLITKLLYRAISGQKLHRVAFIVNLMILPSFKHFLVYSSACWSPALNVAWE